MYVTSDWVKNVCTWASKLSQEHHVLETAKVVNWINQVTGRRSRIEIKPNCYVLKEKPNIQAELPKDDKKSDQKYSLINLVVRATCRSHTS